MTINTLDLEIMFGDIFEKCKTEDELEWVKGQIEGTLETAYDDWFLNKELQD